MFVDGNDDGITSENELDLSNAVPGHLIAYEDMENDLLLAGDLNWKYVLQTTVFIPKTLKLKFNPELFIVFLLFLSHFFYYGLGFKNYCIVYMCGNEQGFCTSG